MRLSGGWSSGLRMICHECLVVFLRRCQKFEVFLLKFGHLHCLRSNTNLMGQCLMRLMIIRRRLLGLLFYSLVWVLISWLFGLWLLGELAGIFGIPWLVVVVVFAVVSSMSTKQSCPKKMKERLRIQYIIKGVQYVSEQGWIRKMGKELQTLLENKHITKPTQINQRVIQRERQRKISTQARLSLFEVLPHEDQIEHRLILFKAYTEVTLFKASTSQGIKLRTPTASQKSLH